MNKILKLLKVSLIINLASLFSAFEEKCDEEPKPLTGYAAAAGAAAASSTTEVITCDQVRGLL